MKTYKITMGKEIPIEVTTDNAWDLLQALLEMSYKGEKNGGICPLGYEDDAIEVLYSDCGDVVPVDTNGSAEELINDFNKINTYDLECKIMKCI